ncbi:MAG: class I tRNA ligase family protein, partial [Lewinella sp.]|nr:class I tRNA ligase family protein [Lewinella sp.]
IWDDFCSWYLEMIKPADNSIDARTYERTLAAYERMMTLLHPFMPFVTEEIWHGLRERAAGDDCCVSSWPQASSAYDAHLIEQVELAKLAVVKIRETRSSKGIKARDPLKLYTLADKAGKALAEHQGLRAAIEKMAFLDSFTVVEQEPENTISFLAGRHSFYLELNQEIDTEAERERLEKDLEYYRGFVISVQKKLSNERFVSGAPAAVVDRERQKLADGEAKIKHLEEALASL